jgi:hypothetical protein
MRVIEEQTREKPMRRTPNSFGVTVMTGPSQKQSRVNGVRSLTTENANGKIARISAKARGKQVREG